MQHLDAPRPGRRSRLSGRQHVLRRQPLRHHHQRHVADDLGGGRHLDDVAEQVVGGAVGLAPPRASASRGPSGAGLLLEVGELAARHLVQIDLRGAGLEVALEGGVLGAHGLPVEADLPDRLGVEAGVALGVAQRLDDRAEAGLRGHAGHGVHGGVDGVDARLDGGEHAGAGDAGGVVGVQVDRQADLFLQRLDQHARGRGLEQPGHVLDAEDVAAGASSSLARST